VEVSGTALKPGRSVEGSVTLRNGAEELLGVMVYFYDGDPAAGGKLVDIERISRLRANGRQKASITFRPQACGAHRLFVRVAPGKEYATSGQAARAVQVECCDSQDATAPTLAVTLTPNTLWPADGRMVPITARISARDDHDQQPEIRLEAITHNEANDASGDVAGAEFGTDDRRFRLRAERNGRHNRKERVYEVTYSATDCAGNKTFTTAYVIVPRRPR
jgi:hypothetical protein